MSKILIHLNLHNKLALPEASTSSRALLCIFHGALAANWFFALLHMYPVVGIIPAAIVLIIEFKRKTAFSKSAFKFALSRFYLNITLISIAGSYTFFTVGQITPHNQAWLLLCYILLPLAIYDAYCASKGGLGLKIMRPLQEKIKRKV